MSKLAGKVALITGAGTRGGIGRAIALRLAKDGADIVVTDLARTFSYRPIEDFREEKPEQWWGIENVVEEVAAMGRRGFAIPADLRNRRQIDSLVTAAWDRFGAVDILVNNAALSGVTVGRRTVIDYDEDTWRQQLDINLTAPFLICKFLARKMVERGKGGKIINISSTRGRVGLWGGSGYCASKFGLIGLTQTMALELAPYNINVNAICPGPIVTWGGRSPQIRQMMREGATLDDALKRGYSDILPLTPLGRLGTPEEVAHLAAYLASSESDYMTGQSLSLDGGYLMH